jgi:sulfotransferase family protein
MFTYIGEIVEVRYSTILGWAMNASRPDDPVHVVLIINGIAVAETVTDSQKRFEIAAPVHVMSSTAVEVSLRDNNGNPVHSMLWGESAREAPLEWKTGSRMSFPSFFVVGAAKSGTTSLHVYLDRHPNIFMSKPKEPFFFEAEYNRGPDYYYRRYFGGWNGQRHVGESRHRNLYLPYVPARIYTYNPEAYIVAILRNPTERAISHWWHWYARRKENLRLFDALQADLRRIQEGVNLSEPEEITRHAMNTGDEGQGHHRTYLDSGYYLEQLSRYEALFGRSKIHIVLADDLFQEPVQTMEEIFDFLDVDPSVAADHSHERFNEAPSGRGSEVTGEVLQWLVDHYRPHNHALARWLGRSLDMWNQPPERL